MGLPGEGISDKADDTRVELAQLINRLPSVVEEVLSRGVKPDIDHDKLPSWKPASNSWSYKGHDGYILPRPPRPDFWVVSDGVFGDGPAMRHGFGATVLTDDGQDIWSGLVVGTNGKLYECRIACTRVNNGSIHDVLSNLGSYPAELRAVLPFTGLGPHDQLSRDDLAKNLQEFAERQPAQGSTGA